MAVSKMSAHALTLFGVLAVGGEVTTAKVGPADLGQVVHWSEVIVVGTVTSVASDPMATRTATITVDEVWKGSPERTIEVTLTSTWPCDTSNAFVGETAVFFLSRREGSWRIVHSGVGRFPIRVVNGQRYCDVVDSLVLMPDTLVRTRIPTETGVVWSYYQLDPLKRVVLGMVKQLAAGTLP